MEMVDLTGKRFGRLTVAALDGPAKGGQLKWICKCSCGSPPKSIRGVMLKSGKTKSCGCLRSETAAKTKTTHGMRNSSEYRIWRGILNRCRNVNESAYPLYGGRGIDICNSWEEFEGFYADMGPRPSTKHSIDRIDVNKGYSPDNCRWATMKEQQRNRSNNRLVTYLGETAPLSQMCEKHGLNYRTVHRRLSLGAPIELAMTDARLPRKSLKQTSPSRG